MSLGLFWRARFLVFCFVICESTPGTHAFPGCIQTRVLQTGRRPPCGTVAYLRVHKWLFCFGELEFTLFRWWRPYFPHVILNNHSGTCHWQQRDQRTNLNRIWIGPAGIIRFQLPRGGWFDGRPASSMSSSFRVRRIYAQVCLLYQSIF